MNELVLENLFYIGTFPFLAAIVHYFFSHCLGCRLKTKLSILLLYSLYCLLSIGLYLSPFTGIVQPLLNLFLLFLLSYFYECSLKWRLGATAFLVAIVILSDALVQLFLMALLSSNSLAIYIVSLFLSKLIMLILAYAAVQFITAYGDGSLSKWYWSFLFVCPILSLWGAHGLFRLTRNFPSFESSWLWIYTIILIGLIFINFFVFILCDYVLRLQAMQTQTLLLEKQISYYTHQYTLAESVQKETLQFRHDLKNILIGLQAKLKARKVTESKQMLHTLIGDFSSSKGIAHSGNLIVDSIINYKQQRAHSFLIPFSIDLRLPPDIILDSTSISVILGNALDNAIEACRRIEDGEKYIKIQMHYQNESLFIRIENPYNGMILTDITGKIRSSKKTDSKSHGIGLNSIRTMIEKHHGHLDISYDENIFQMEIILFNIKRSA